MKKSLRFYFTIFLTRILMLAMRIVGYKSTYFPGVFSLKLCPDFLKMLSKPGFIICVTGTNGKSTTTNMIADFLKAKGKNLAYNKLGSNMAEGIISTLLAEGTSFWGRSTKDLGLFEVDERSSEKVYSGIKPDYILVTNLFRDTIRREANTDFIFDIMDKAIPLSSTLILNADDIISSGLAKSNNRIYYGISRLDGEKEVRNSLVKDAVYNFDALERYEYEFMRYHHIGKIKGYSPDPDYNLIKHDKEKGSVIVSSKGINESYKLVSANDTDLYNQLCAIALFKEMGYTRDEINEGFSNVKVMASRYEEIEVKGKKIIFFLSKGCAPVAASRVLKHVADYPGISSVILINEEEYALSYYNSWFYEVDYAQLAEDNIRHIVAAGYYSKDFHLALLLEGVNGNKIVSIPDHVDSVNRIDLSADNIFVIYGLDTICYREEIRDKLIARIEREVA